MSSSAFLCPPNSKISPDVARVRSRVPNTFADWAFRTAAFRSHLLVQAFPVNTGTGLPARCFRWVGLSSYRRRRPVAIDP